MRDCLEMKASLGDPGFDIGHFRFPSGFLLSRLTVSSPGPSSLCASKSCSGFLSVAMIELSEPLVGGGMTLF